MITRSNVRPTFSPLDGREVPLFMALEVKGNAALAELFDYLARELRAGTVDRVSIETIVAGQSRVSIVFNTTMVATMPGMAPDEPEPDGSDDG